MAKRLSESMERMLYDLLTTGDAFYSRRGLSQHGGEHGTWSALMRMELIDRESDLTEAGRREAERIQGERNRR